VETPFGDSDEVTARSEAANSGILCAVGSSFSKVSPSSVVADFPFEFHHKVAVAFVHFVDFLEFDIHVQLNLTRWTTTFGLKTKSNFPVGLPVLQFL